MTTTSLLRRAKESLVTEDDAGAWTAMAAIYRLGDEHNQEALHNAVNALSSVPPLPPDADHADLIAAFDRALLLVAETEVV